MRRENTGLRPGVTVPATAQRLHSRRDARRGCTRTPTTERCAYVGETERVGFGSVRESLGITVCRRVTEQERDCEHGEREAGERPSKRDYERVCVMRERARGVIREVERLLESARRRETTREAAC